MYFLRITLMRIRILDPSFHLVADFTFHFNADPDPVPHQSDVSFQGPHGSILSLKDPEL
jgi:hypothetical protein